jgi:hypothetical protein
LIESQEIHVRFEPAAPRIHLDAVYHLQNNGNQPLSSVEIRLPGRLAFKVENAEAKWDGSPLSSQVSLANPRNTLFPLPGRWKISERHTLELSSDFEPPLAEGSHFSFTADAFFLPSEGWAPDLLPARGFIASGGVPPKQWRLSVRVPQDFLVHTSGRSAKSSRSGGEAILEATQTLADQYPFVVAGKYRESSLDAGPQKVLIWSRSSFAPAGLRDSVDALSRIVQVYNQAFGNRSKTSAPLWIVECPVVPGCFTTERSSYAEFLGAEPGATSSEMASADTLMLNFSGAPTNLAAAAPSLAASWLGYGQNPGFYDPQPPLSAFPAFASALGREAVLGASARIETIRRALAVIPRVPPEQHPAEHRPSGRAPEDPAVIRAKSVLFFYALQDRYGLEVFHRAVNHMLSARRGGGFDLADLIAAFEEETHQNVAEFVRLWMKHPGVPDDFRARYEGTVSAFAGNSKENTP